MTSQVGRLLGTAALAAVLAVAGAPAGAQPVFGPETYVRTAGPQDVYTDTFPFAAQATLPLWVHNGDEGGHRVSSGSIAVNGQTVVTPADLSQNVALFARPAALVSGSNTITVTLGGEPGGFITVWIPHPHRPAHATLGRVLLPFGQAPGLVLDLKNGSHDHARRVRVVFFDPSGAPVAASAALQMPPRASLSLPAVQLIHHGSWNAGSIEVFYAGAGMGRLFGQAVETDAHTGVSGIVELQQAGHRLVEPPPPANVEDVTAGAR